MVPGRAPRSRGRPRRDRAGDGADQDTASQDMGDRAFQPRGDRRRAGLGPVRRTPGAGALLRLSTASLSAVRGLETWARLATFFRIRSSVTALVSALHKIVQASRMVRSDASRRQHVAGTSAQHRRGKADSHVHQL